MLYLELGGKEAGPAMFDGECEKRESICRFMFIDRGSIVCAGQLTLLDLNNVIFGNCIQRGKTIV